MDNLVEGFENPKALREKEQDTHFPRVKMEPRQLNNHLCAFHIQILTYHWAPRLILSLKFSHPWETGG